MTRNWLRFAELMALWSLAAGALAVSAYMISIDRMGEAFGTLLGIIPLIVQRISNIGQAQAMQAMTEALANSQPSPRDLPIVPDIIPQGMPDPAFGKEL